MPELPDIVTYLKALEPRILGERLSRVRIGSTFLLRTAEPSIREVEGRVVLDLKRIGKRIAIGVENDLWLVLHLMIAGRLHWRPPQASLAGRNNLGAFDFPKGSLVLTEAGTKRRASLHLVSGQEALRSMDPGGIDIFETDLESFPAALTAENPTQKRELTDPRMVDGSGNPD
jgi:formamidopyrimidine-DNA glycosylase